MDKPIEGWIEKWGIMLDWEAKAELRKAVEPEEHWFREHAETTPIQYLPLTAVSAIRAVAYGDNKDKLGSIKQIIEIYEELLKEGK